MLWHGALENRYDASDVDSWVLESPPSVGRERNQHIQIVNESASSSR